MLLDRRAVARPDHLPHVDRLLLPLRLHRLCLAEFEGLASSEIRFLADQNSVRRGGRLDPCGRVEDVTGRRPLSLAGPCAEHDERLTRVDADANVKVEPLVLAIQLGNRALHSERCTNGSLWIVLVRFRRAEQRQHRVAAELLEGSPMALELGPHPRVVGRDQGLDVLGVELFRARRRAHEVDEDCGDHLSLLASRWRRSRGIGKRRAALMAEPSFLRVLRPACRTHAHTSSVRRWARGF